MDNPFSQTPVRLVIDGYCVWRVVLALCGADDAAVDPVVDDRFADSISFTELPDAERAGRALRGRNPVFVAHPSDDTCRKRFTRRALVALGAE